MISRDQAGDIEFVIQFRPDKNVPLITYEIAIGLDGKNKAVVKKEVLRFRRGQHGSPWKVLDFTLGEGIVVEGKLSTSFSQLSLKISPDNYHINILPLPINYPLFLKAFHYRLPPASPWQHQF